MRTILQKRFIWSQNALLSWHFLKSVDVFPGPPLLSGLFLVEFRVKLQLSALAVVIVLKEGECLNSFLPDGLVEGDPLQKVVYFLLIFICLLLLVQLLQTFRRKFLD